MSLPALRPGLVISYGYVWAEEHMRGVEEGRKDRPCAVVAARRIMNGEEIATVVPVTHTPPKNEVDAIEIPQALKAHLGLDAARSWIVVAEVNEFIWPGPDLRPVSRRMPAKFHYGMLPPKFFAHLQEKILAQTARAKLRRVRRTD